MTSGSPADQVLGLQEEVAGRVTVPVTEYLILVSTKHITGAIWWPGTEFVMCRRADHPDSMFGSPSCSCSLDDFSRATCSGSLGDQCT